ncbi:hypothetical protein BaRGS_00022321 [Batillaria attramentaria]|uniref:Uncharacterized protein n=1 Tax=Batillaria attramentaria TaxID=370345 RepID=A0ABD0KHK4_9CAEN
MTPHWLDLTLDISHKPRSGNRFPSPHRRSMVPAGFHGTKELGRGLNNFTVRRANDHQTGHVCIVPCNSSANIERNRPDASFMSMSVSGILVVIVCVGCSLGVQNLLTCSVSMAVVTY